MTEMPLGIYLPSVIGGEPSGWLRGALERPLLFVAPMHREAEAIKRKQTFLFCRYVLILATGALAFIEVNGEVSPAPVAVVMVLAILSNVVLGQVSPFAFFDAWTQAPVLVSDTAMISACLVLTRASQEFFFFFFFVLIMAAKLENLSVLAAGAALIGLASFLTTDLSAGWISPALMRIPFFFATGIFFGYVVLPERTGQMQGFSRPRGPSYIRPPAPRVTKRPSVGESALRI
ncbi:MAG: hypothetical protein HY699_07190 [Deltaproteobacteria bacterium]|nr:hypothetical protein [Deltaproteobacteria bacterium]